jgi:hypothetical protein
LDLYVRGGASRSNVSSVSFSDFTAITSLASVTFYLYFFHHQSAISSMLPVGELESTILHHFIRAGKLKRWLSRPDCPQAIKECKVLFDKAYDSKVPDDAEINGDVETFHVKASQAVPSDLCQLVKKLKVGLQARLKLRGIVYSTVSAHVGNSLVYFYPKGNKSSSPVPGSIKYIVSRKGEATLAVRRQLPCNRNQGFVDPFSRYAHFPARLYDSRLSDILEEVKTEWVMCHFARWNISSEHAVVLSLSRVLHLFSPLT